MPVTVDQLLKHMSVTIKLTDNETLVLRELDAFTVEELQWLLSKETVALTAQPFAQYLIHRLLLSPHTSLEAISIWPDEKLVRILAQWLYKQQFFDTEKQAENCSLEQLKQAVYDFQNQHITALTKSIALSAKQVADGLAQSGITSLLKSLEGIRLPNLEELSRPTYLPAKVSLPINHAAETEARLRELIAEVRAWRHHSEIFHAHMTTKTRLFITEIDSFSKVNDIPLSQVNRLLNGYGRLEGYSYNRSVWCS
jgi:hypothetical protein